MVSSSSASSSRSLKYFATVLSPDPFFVDRRGLRPDTNDPDPAAADAPTPPAVVVIPATIGGAVVKAIATHPKPTIVIIRAHMDQPGNRNRVGPARNIPLSTTFVNIDQYPPLAKPCQAEVQRSYVGENDLEAGKM